jgi:hypothetical protein
MSKDRDLARMDGTTKAVAEVLYEINAESSHQQQYRGSRNVSLTALMGQPSRFSRNRRGSRWTRSPNHGSFGRTDLTLTAQQRGRRSTGTSDETHR